MSLSKIISIKKTKMKKDLHTPNQELTRRSSSSFSASKPLPNGNGRLCERVVTPRVHSGRKRLQSLTKIREQYIRNKVEAQVLEADGTIMSMAEEDEATNGYQYPDDGDSEESDSSMPPMMDIAELGNRKTPTSFYSNFEVGRDDNWKYTIPETNSGSPPPRSPPSTYQPPTQPTSTYHQPPSAFQHSYQPTSTYQPTYSYPPPSDPPTWTYHPALQPNHHSQPPYQPPHSYQPPFPYMNQELPRDFWEPVLPTPRNWILQPTHGREDQRLDQEELEELKRLNQEAGHSFEQLHDHSMPWGARSSSNARSI
jgi:hypothetical protein